MNIRTGFIPKMGKTLYENAQGLKTGTATLKESIENYKYILVLTNLGSILYYCGHKPNIEFFASSFANVDQVYNSAMVVTINSNTATISYNKRWYGSTVENNKCAIFEIIGFNQL